MTKGQYYKAIKALKTDIFAKFEKIEEYNEAIKTTHGAEKRIAYKNRDMLYKEITKLNESKMTYVSQLKAL
jgi:hypothetical protein